MKNIWRIIQISKPLHHLVGWLALLILVGAALEQVSPILSKYIVDEITANVQGTGGDVTRLAWLIGLAFGASFLGIVLGSVSERLGDHFAGRLRKYLIERFYDKVFRLPQSYFDSELSGKLINQLNRGIFTIENFMGSASNFILPTFMQSIFTVAVLAYYNVPVAILVTILFPIYLVLSYYSSKRWGVHEVEKNKLEDASRGRISEVINNIKLVKTFTNELREWLFVSEKQEGVNKIYAKQSLEYHVFDFFRNLSLILILLAVDIIVFYNTFQGNLSLGEMVLLLQLVNQSRRPLFAMSFVLGQIQRAESGSKEFFEVLDIPVKENYDSKEKVQFLKKPEIKFDHVSFKYETSETVLKDVSFTMKPNETVALVGHSGAGKSTIVNMILKLYEATEGEIYLNDKPYSKLSHKFIRNQIAMVLQENELFSTTIGENVAYGTQATEKAIIKALKLANAYDFVMKLPKGLKSEIGERGVRLSGGQKQRIQIARAILANSPILILDEATSSLDAKSELEVQEGMKHLMKNKLVIIIAHRFSTIQNVDRILVLDQGRIVDQGTPNELAKRDGIYSQLLQYQIDGNKKLLANYELY